MGNQYRNGFWLLTVFMCLGVGLAHAAIDAYPFADQTQEARFQSLTEELRCPKCQNQNIADSNAPIAADLRRKVHDLIQAGQSDREIVDYMVQRYGSFVTYRPPFNVTTALLWIGPMLLIAVVALALVWRLRRQSQSPPVTALAADEQARLERLLGTVDKT